MSSQPPEEGRQPPSLDPHGRSMPYGQPPAYGPPPPQYGGFGPPPAYGPPPPQYGGFGPPPPAPPENHPQATLAMVLGIIGVAGGLLCYVPILCAPFAWFIGRRAGNEIDTDPGRWGGRGMAHAGFILGIIGTVLLILGVIGLAIVIAFAISADSSSGGGY